MVRFLLILRRDRREKQGSPPPSGQVIPWLVVVVASFVVPWSLYPAIADESLASLIEPEALWKLSWPLLLGVAAMLLVHRIPRLEGAIPEGDIVVLGKMGDPVVRRVSNGIAEIDVHLRRWPVAGLGLLALVILLGGALMLRA
jgi:hypothetical protein